MNKLFFTRLFQSNLTATSTSSWSLTFIFCCDKEKMNILVKKKNEYFKRKLIIKN